MTSGKPRKPRRWSLDLTPLRTNDPLLVGAALPRFLRYDGRDGLSRKIAEDEAHAARATQATDRFVRP